MNVQFDSHIGIRQIYCLVTSSRDQDSFVVSSSEVFINEAFFLAADLTIDHGSTQFFVDVSDERNGVTKYECVVFPFLMYLD